MTHLPRPPRAGRIAALAALPLALAATTGTASAAVDPTGVLPIATKQLTLTIPATVERANCATTRVAGSGATLVPWVAAQTAELTFKLTGAAGSDWDLAVFDHASGKRLGGSGVFGIDELVQAYAVQGKQLDVQACRVAGPASTAKLTVSGVELPKVQLPKTLFKESLVRIRTPKIADYSLLQGLGLDLGEDAGPSGVSAVIHSAADLELLKAMKFDYVTKVADLAEQDAKDRAADDRATLLDTRASALPSGRTSYRVLAEIQADLKKIVQDHPAIAKPVTLPVKTFQGRDTMGVEFSSNVNATDDQKPVSFVMGLHHAREWPSAEVQTEFALYLAQNYGTDPRVTNLLNTVRIVVVPVINSDGYIASREAPLPPLDDLTGDPAGAPSLAESVAPPFGGYLQYRRKNCQGASPLAETPCEAQYGTDPNRNYGQLWGGFGASTDTGSQSYRGTGQWSAPESEAVHRYSQSRPINTLLTMHNFASLVLRPPGTGQDGLAPDEDRLKAIGDQMADDTGYTSEYSYQLYDTSGTTEDWNYGAAGTYGYTMEMGPTADDGGNFHVAYQQGVIDQWTGKGKYAGKASARRC